MLCAALSSCQERSKDSARCVILNAIARYHTGPIRDYQELTWKGAVREGGAAVLVQFGGRVIGERCVFVSDGSEVKRGAVLGGSGSYHQVLQLMDHGCVVGDYSWAQVG